MALASVLEQTEAELHHKSTHDNSSTGQWRYVGVNKGCAKCVGGNSVNDMSVSVNLH